MPDKEEKMIDRLAEDTETILDIDYAKKDLKEQRSVVKNALYDGSKKLKHQVPKGKRS